MIRNIIIAILLFALMCIGGVKNAISVDSYNKGYREGMLYAYDNIVVCGASPEAEGLRLAGMMGRPITITPEGYEVSVSDISCEE